MSSPTDMSTRIGFKPNIFSSQGDAWSNESSPPPNKTCNWDGNNPFRIKGELSFAPSASWAAGTSEPSTCSPKSSVYHQEPCSSQTAYIFSLLLFPFPLPFPFVEGPFLEENEVEEPLDLRSSTWSVLELPPCSQHSHDQTGYICNILSLMNLSCFFLLGAAWVRSRAERPSVSQVTGQLRVQFGCKLSGKLKRKRIGPSRQQISETNSKFKIKCRDAVRPRVLTRWRWKGNSTDTAEVLLVYTCNEVAQGESTIGLVEVSWVYTRDEVTNGKDGGRKRRGRVGVEQKCVVNDDLTSEWNSWSARKWRAHAQLYHYWSWWEEVKQRWASQSPLRIHSVQLGVVKELDNDEVTFHEVHSQAMSSRWSSCSGEWGTASSSVKANLQSLKSMLPTESLVDSLWQSVSKITIGSPIAAGGAGWQQGGRIRGGGGWR